MNNSLTKLCVLRNLYNDPIFSAIVKSGNTANNEEILYELLKVGAECDLYRYIGNIILLDENAFSHTCASKKNPSVFLLNAYVADLKFIFEKLKGINEHGLFCKGNLPTPFDKKFDAKKTADNLAEFYQRYGYGKFIFNKAFIYKDSELVPVKNTATITLEELKNYQYEKKVISDNIINFISGLPYSHMLLYGDRGTGKSSTIHAMLNKYYADGLRIIELNKENMLDIPQIRSLICDNPLKFIIFIDDLSLGEYDEKVSSLKASLEGSVSGGTNNTMIVATSNRRHIVKESFNDRENSIHPSDSMSEQLSLSDRFGLTVNFSTTDKDGYLQIVGELAKDKNIRLDKEKLYSLAERWALVKGGRSPRRAKQFIDLVYSCVKRGIEIDF
jgi:hypothetical protein